MLAYSWRVEISRILHNSYTITWGIWRSCFSDITALPINQIYTKETLYNKGEVQVNESSALSTTGLGKVNMLREDSFRAQE